MRTRAIIIVALTAVAAWAALSVGAVFYAERTADSVDDRAVVSSLGRAKAALDYETTQLQKVSTDWAAWDDTYQFVKDVNRNYIANNLADDTFNNLGVDFMVFTDRSGRVVYAKALDPLSRGHAGLPDGVRSYLAGQPPLLHMSDPRKGVSGILSTAGGVYLVAAHPVGTSDFKSPPDGTLFMGYRLTPAMIDHLKRLTLLSMSIYSVQATALPGDVVRARSTLSSGTSSLVSNMNDRDAAGYSLLPGIDPTSALLLKVVQSREAFTEARRSIMWIGAAVSVFGLMFFGLLALALDRTVLRRLALVSREVRTVGVSGDADARLKVEGRDEISGLAKDVNEMLDELGRSHNELAYLASYDPLTRLHNRRFFEEELDRELAEHRRLRASGAVLWLDLDHFKDVNDSLGHIAGDELLAALGERLAAESRGYSVVARVGGDQFGILLPHTSAHEAMRAASRLVEVVSSCTFPAGDHEVRVSASIGVVAFPGNGEDASGVLSEADLAMYDAKAAGGNQAFAFTGDGSRRGEMTRRIETAERIVSALRDERLVLYAQPIIDLAHAGGGSFELLLRMIGTDGAIIPPDEFIPTAERLGLIRDIDRWVARRAIGVLSQEQAAGHDVTFAINISGAAFGDPELLDIIREDLVATGANPKSLIIEVTETTAIANIEAASRFVKALREIGCRFSLDDFGSGASSFYHLRHLPIDFLKIDGTLVRGLSRNHVDAHFVRAIVDMCEGLEIRTIAEYVEDEETLQAVRALGVDYAQGYHVGRPAPLDSYLDKRARSGSSLSQDRARVRRLVEAG